MASFNIHEDQENCPTATAAFRAKNQPLGPQQKRPVLGAIDNQFFAPKPSRGDENVPQKLAVPTKGAPQQQPIVPVAQFEAFKVYEDFGDENGVQRAARIVEEDIYSNVYKGTEEDRFVTKKEVKEMAARLKNQQLLQVEREIAVSVSDPERNRIIGSPMSIEKEKEKAVIREKGGATSRSARERFFECTDYRDSILAYLKDRELLNRPKPFYMRKQPDIKHNMRAILVDWLVEVAEEYKLHTETLYLSVNYIDRFLSFMSVVRAKLQLVGTAAMFIAAKYEEIYPPDVGEFVYITDDTYNKRQVLRMEMLILRILDYELAVPTPYTFISAMCIANQQSDNIMHLAMYISELALLEAEPTLEILPSMIAVSSIAIARHTLHESDVWTKGLEECSGYKLVDMKKTVDYLYKLHRSAPGLPQQAIQSKYKAAKYLNVADVPSRNQPLEVV